MIRFVNTIKDSVDIYVNQRIRLINLKYLDVSIFIELDKIVFVDVKSHNECATIETLNVVVESEEYWTIYIYGSVGKYQLKLVRDDLTCLVSKNFTKVYCLNLTGKKINVKLDNIVLSEKFKHISLGKHQLMATNFSNMMIEIPANFNVILVLIKDDVLEIWDKC